MAELLGRLGKTDDERILVGPETSDDAGVVLLGDGTAIVQTVDFFPPVVDDPRDYGRIAAANSMSDIYAMGAKPLSVMNIVAWPKKLGIDLLAEILKGAGEKIEEAGALLIGGHTIENEQIMYGLSVTAVSDPAGIVRNSTARPGEALILTKALGSGILATAAKRKALDGDVLKRLVAMMSRLNEKASEVMLAAGASACTDVTGFGFMGHLFEVAQSSNVSFEVEAKKVPLFTEALHFSARGFLPGGSGRNRDYLEGHYEIAGHVDEHMQNVLFDAQTSGGLLFTVAEDKADETVKKLRDAGDEDSAVIGRSLPHEGPYIRLI